MINVTSSRITRGGTERKFNFHDNNKDDDNNDNINNRKKNKFNKIVPYMIFIQILKMLSPSTPPPLPNLSSILAKRWLETLVGGFSSARSAFTATPRSHLSSHFSG